MRTRIYANYGITDRKGNPVYSAREMRGATNDPMIVELPNGFQITGSGDIVSNRLPKPIPFSEMLGSRQGKPCIRWNDKTGRPGVKNLKIIYMNPQRVKREAVFSTDNAEIKDGLIYLLKISKIEFSLTTEGDRFRFLIQANAYDQALIHAWLENYKNR